MLLHVGKQHCTRSCAETLISRQLVLLLFTFEVFVCQRHNRRLYRVGACCPFHHDICAAISSDQEEG